MYYILYIFLMISVISQAQDIQTPIHELKVEDFCNGDQIQINGLDFTIKDDGFCKNLQEIKNENSQVDINFIQDINHSLNNIEPTNLILPRCNENLPNPFAQQSNLQDSLNANEDKWKIRFYASHSFTTYFDTDIEFRSTRYNVDVKDYHWTERGNRNFFKPSKWFEPGNNPAQMIDEPSNTFVISIEKNGNEFFLSAFHPKFFQQDQTKYMVGTIDGTPVDGVFPINRPHDGYNQDPGEMELVRNENTHMQMMFEVGYGHRFKLLDGKAGSLTYTPSIGMGLTMGQNKTVVLQEGEWWEHDEFQDKTTIQGFGGSMYNKVQYEIPNKKIGIFYENRLSYYKQDHKFMDGTQKYDLKLMGHSIGINFMIYNPAKHKK